MAAPNDIPLRIARDRLIDLLRIGDSYPLTDLDVIADRLKITHGGRVEIPIDRAQAGVLYELRDPDGDELRDPKGAPLDGDFKAAGNDVRAQITTPSVIDDITYRIRATKEPSGAPPLAPQAPRLLDEGAPVKVGLDTTLKIVILEAPLLDPAIGNPQPSDPRIVPYGASVDVEITDSQEAVEYSLMLDGKDMAVSSPGTQHNIKLRAGPLFEDTVIQVRATKNFPRSLERDPETSLLKAKLYVKVMANRALAVSVDSSIVDYNQGATLKIAATQASAKYRAYVRAIPDADFVHGSAAGVDVVSVAVAGKPDAQVRKPPQSKAWSLPEGYAPAGDAVAGTGGELKLAVKALTDDVMVIVQAVKEHLVDADNKQSPIVASSIRLDQAAVVLVRPDPARTLTLRVPVNGAQIGETMQVSGGQPGVYYYFRPAPAGADFPRAAYFHKSDDRDKTQNKGVGRLAIEVDLAIAADSEVRPADPATAPPRLPLLGITPLDARSLSVRAVKAQSAVETKMAKDAQIPMVRAMRAEPPLVDAGSATKIVISDSIPIDEHQLMLNAAPMGPRLAGNKADLEIVTGPLTASANFEVVVTRPTDEGMRVERVVSVPVAVRPKAP